MEVSENLPLPAKEIERNREEDTDKEEPQEAVVNGTNAEYLLGSEGAPKDGGGEETVETRAGEVVLLVRCANIGDLRHLVVKHGCADESGNEGSKHLGAERNPRWDVGVMSELEILSEVEGVCGGEDSEDLHVDHCSDVTGEPEATEHLCDNAEANFHVGNSLDDAAGNCENDGEEDTIKHGRGEHVGRVHDDTSGTDANGGTQDDEVYPLGNLSV